MVKITKRQIEFIRFGLVGAINTGIDFTVFAILFAWGVPLLPAHSLSYTCGILNSYLLNRRWTFKHDNQSAGKQSSRLTRQLIKFAALNLFTLSITYGLLVWFHNDLGCPILLSRVLAVGVSFALNFTGSRLWVFRQPQNRNVVV